MGPIGNLHADIYQASRLAELVGVCDVMSGRATRSRDRLGVPSFTTVQEMLNAVKPDLSSIATGGFEYGGDHFEPTMQSLAAGCHVLCEKPISNEISQAEEMVRFAREQNLCLGVDFNHRFTPAARLAKRWIDEDRIGSTLFANVALWIGRPGSFDSPYFHLKALNPHSIDLIRHFCGEIDSVQCFACKAPGRDLWSTASFNFKLRSGAVAHLTSSYDVERGHPMERCEVAGVKGRFVLDDMWREATLYPAGDPIKQVFTNPIFGGYKSFDDTFKSRLETFLQQVSDGVSPEVIDGSGADGLAAQSVIAAAIDSLETGSVVHLRK
jgi:predicted dehydrogenase